MAVGFTMGGIRADLRLSRGGKPYMFLRLCGGYSGEIYNVSDRVGIGA